MSKQTEPGDLDLRFEWALGTLWMAYQPIVSVSGRSVVAYEGLVRNEEESLRNPNQLFAAAAQLNRLDELGQAIRGTVASVVPALPANLLLFANVHPHDLLDEQLFIADAPLSRVADRVVLEITEGASVASIEDVSERLALLRRLGYRIAIDDFGAGYASFSAFTTVRPDVVKIDMSLVRGVANDRIKQRLVGSVVEACRALDIVVVAEGIETVAERDAVSALGCDLLQGYFFGRPAHAILGRVNPELFP